MLDLNDSYGVKLIPSQTLNLIQQELDRRNLITNKVIKRLKEDLSNAWNKFHAVRHENNKLRKENERLLNEIADLEVRHGLAQECLQLAHTRITTDNKQ